MLAIDNLGQKLSAYLPTEQVNYVKRAYFYAEQAHEGQIRRSGEPYVTHPLAVADILAEMHMDHQSLMAAMLHDVIEDTAVNKPALENQFGETVAELVDGVSKLTQIEGQSRAEAQAENFQKMALAMARDIRVILVKLADRLHNMRTLDVLGTEKRRRISKETLEIYAPIAQRLGMHNMRIEFEDLGFSTLYPMRTRRIKAAVRAARGNRKEYVDTIRETLEITLKQEGHTAEVLGREKHLYSIYRKMRTKRKSFADIMDIYAFRIIVDSVDTCYRVLGAIHSLYKPLPGQFKDYIAIPKANGYQSLHTVLFGSHGVPIEIQIRTKEMEDMANNGIAAHWLYKSDDSGHGSHIRARQWVQGLLEMQQRAGNSLEFIENVKIDLFPDEVYVFTPKGGILELPQGATSVDFAYAVHSDIGNSCVACRINRRLASLSEPLQSGQTVEIITAPGAHPNPAWLNYVVTAKARATIRHALKQQQFSESIALGKRLLEKSLQDLNTNFDAISDERKQRLAESTGTDNFDVVLQEIGTGDRVSSLTARQILADPNHEDVSNNADNPIIISGTEGFRLNFARCCHPLPGDPIIGFISAEKGIVVHTESCHNTIETRGVREAVSLKWADQVEGDFVAELRVELENSRGLIALLANRINAMDVNIEHISIEDKNPRISVLHLEIAVHDRINLARVMRRIRTIKAVTKVTRAKH